MLCMLCDGKHENRGNPEVQLLIGGKGPLAKELKTLASELSLCNSVRFLGFIPEEDLVLTI